MADALRTYLDHVSALSSGQASDDLRAVSSEVGRWLAADDPEVRDALGAALPDMSPAGAGWTALLLGARVERGGDPAYSLDPLLSLLEAWLGSLPAVAEEDEIPELTLEQGALVSALEPLTMSIVSHLVAAPDVRAALGRDAAFMGRIHDALDFTHAATWLDELLQRRSGGLLLLHPPTGKGARVRFENVASCFHLFSLIQHTVGTRLPGGRRPSADVLACARGEAPSCGGDQAWWHFGHPASPKAEFMASIWGEGTVDSIPFASAFEGAPPASADERVMLLWPPVLQSRAWGEGFFHPQLSQERSVLEWVGPLPKEESAAWLRALGCEPPPTFWSRWFL